MQFYLSQLTDNLRITLLLQQDASPAGTFVNPEVDMTAVDNVLLQVEPARVLTNPFQMIGKTDSKLEAILATFKGIKPADPEILKKKIGNRLGEIEDVYEFDPRNYLNMAVRIPGTDVTAKLTEYHKDKKEYILYADTPNPIKYVDFPDGTTTFMFDRDAEENPVTPPLLNKFSGLVEEPKIESLVFIERGAVNVFEPFKKLKKVKTLNEMIKFGFGYYKINKQGFNFKKV